MARCEMNYFLTGMWQGLNKKLQRETSIFKYETAVLYYTKSQ